MPNRRGLILSGFAVLAAGLLMAGFSVFRRMGEPRKPNVILIVMDTTRRDHVGPCGGLKVATPALLKLAAKGTTFCGMVAPGSWTLPVHASIFTGELPTVHGADFAPEGQSVPGVPTISFSAMKHGIPTLAEYFQKNGYETIFVSANPVLDPSTGVTRGFDRVSIARSFAMTPDALVFRRVYGMVKDLPRDKPLFLFVNIVVAHGPFEGVPPRQKWIHQSPPLDLFDAPIESSRFARYMRDTMPIGEQKDLVDHLRVVYDWGVYLADREVDRIVRLLTEDGWLTENSTLIVTSDHGEFLGEHHLLDHGRSVEPADIDVFAIAVGPEFARDRRNTSLVQSQDIFPTLLRSANIPYPPLRSAVPLQAPRDDRIAITISQPDPLWETLTCGRAGVNRYVAVQQKNERVVWTAPDQYKVQSFTANGETVSFEVTPRLRPLLRIALAYSRLAPTYSKPAAPMATDVQKSLRALGYLR